MERGYSVETVHKLTKVNNNSAPVLFVVRSQLPPYSHTPRPLIPPITPPRLSKIDRWFLSKLKNIALMKAAASKARLGAPCLM